MPLRDDFLGEVSPAWGLKEPAFLPLTVYGEEPGKCWCLFGVGNRNEGGHSGVIKKQTNPKHVEGSSEVFTGFWFFPM